MDIFLTTSGFTVGVDNIVRAHDAVLVTHNGAEFSRVVGLRLEDWEE